MALAAPLASQGLALVQGSRHEASLGAVHFGSRILHKQQPGPVSVPVPVLMPVSVPVPVPVPSSPPAQMMPVLWMWPASDDLSPVRWQVP